MWLKPEYLQITDRKFKSIKRERARRSDGYGLINETRIHEVRPRRETVELCQVHGSNRWRYSPPYRNQQSAGGGAKSRLRKNSWHDTRWNNHGPVILAPPVYHFVPVFFTVDGAIWWYFWDFWLQKNYSKYISYHKYLYRTLNSSREPYVWHPRLKWFHFCVQPFVTDTDYETGRYRLHKCGRYLRVT